MKDKEQPPHFTEPKELEGFVNWWNPHVHTKGYAPGMWLRLPKVIHCAYGTAHDFEAPTDPYQKRLSWWKQNSHFTVSHKVIEDLDLAERTLPMGRALSWEAVAHPHDKRLTVVGALCIPISGFVMPRPEKKPFPAHD